MPTTERAGSSWALRRDVPLPGRGTDGIEVGVVGLAGRGLAAFAGCSAGVDGFADVADFVAGIFAGIFAGVADCVAGGGAWVLVFGVAAGTGFAVFAAFFVSELGAGFVVGRRLFGEAVSVVAVFAARADFVVAVLTAGPGSTAAGRLDIAGAFADFVADFFAGIVAGVAAGAIVVFAGALALIERGASMVEGDSAFVDFAGSLVFGAGEWVSAAGAAAVDAGFAVFAAFFVFVVAA